MTKETLKALKGSIKKWEDIRDNGGIDLNSSNCPLCQKFLEKRASCKGCPVAVKTSFDLCRETPYYDWYEHHRVEEHPMTEGLKVEEDCIGMCYELADKEVKFLRSLLPKEKK